MVSIINWSAIASLGFKIVTVVLPQIGVVEALAKAIPSLHGQQKEDTAVALTHQALDIADEVAGKVLLSDPAVEAATREFVRSYVALQNVIASRHSQQ